MGSYTAEMYYSIFYLQVHVVVPFAKQAAIQCYSLKPQYMQSNSLSQEKDLNWFPRMRAMSLCVGEAEGELNEVRSLNNKLDRTQTLVDSLVVQLTDLKDEVSIC